MTESKANSSELLREILSDLEGIRDEYPKYYLEILNDLINFYFPEP